MKIITIILIVAVFLGITTYAVTSSSSINWLSRQLADTLYAPKVEGGNQTQILADECADAACTTLIEVAENAD